MPDTGSSVAPGDGLALVRILGMPLKVAEESRTHHDGLLREFALIRFGGGGTEDLPARLVALAGDLTDRFSSFTEATDAEWARAEARGDVVVDLVYRVPPEAGPAAAEIAALLDEADEYCRSGALLTLITPEPAAAFRRWFLGEFARQIAGGEPQRWPGSGPEEVQ